MANTGIVYRYRKTILKAAPLLVLALIWLWVVIAVLILGVQDLSFLSLFGWNFMA